MAVGGGGGSCERQAHAEGTGAQFTCFTGTKVQILTPEELPGERDGGEVCEAGGCEGGAARLASTRVQILMQLLVQVLTELVAAQVV